MEQSFPSISPHAKWKTIKPSVINLLNADERKQQGYVLVETKQTVESDKLNFNLDLLFMCATVVNVSEPIFLFWEQRVKITIS